MTQPWQYASFNHKTVSRRQYRDGIACQDCGTTKHTTTVTFWLNGMRYRVCGECVKAYRGRLLKPCICERDTK